MTEELIEVNSQVLESLVLQGDISKMQPAQKVEYYKWLCSSLGLNPATQPFQIIKFQGREQLYAKKDATEQLRRIYGVSVTELEKLFKDDLYIVTAKVSDRNGRCDAATGAVVIKNLHGEALANAIMKAETKAKRRATLSICGLGMLDESETDTIGKFETVNITTGEITQTGEPPKCTRDLIEETKDIDTKEKYLDWEKTLITEEDKKAAYGIKGQVQYRLTKLNIDSVINKITKATNEKTFFTIEQIISEEKDLNRKRELIDSYHKMLETRGFEHRYTSTPFEEMPE